MPSGTVILSLSALVLTLAGVGHIATLDRIASTSSLLLAFMLRVTRIVVHAGTGAEWPAEVAAG